MENVEELKLTRWDCILTFEELMIETRPKGDQHPISH